jgi:uncharacterized protein YfbU (UPF0304 family)
MTTISVISKYQRMLGVWLQYSWHLIISVWWAVTTISLTSKYQRILDLWLQYPWHLNSNVCSACDYNIRDFKIFTYVEPLTTISVTSKYLRMLNLWQQYPWLLNMYVCSNETTIYVIFNSDVYWTCG